MLKVLNLKNLALIDHLCLSFEPGLNVISGETGAGKSLIIAALALLTGRRASSEEIGRAGSETVVEGLFEFSDKFGTLTGTLAAFGINFESDDGKIELLIRRSLSKEGKNRILINDQLASLAQLAQVGRSLIDIAGQFDFQVLLDGENHINLLDDFAGLDDERGRFGADYGRYQSMRAELERLEALETDSVQRREFLLFQLNDIASKNLLVDEESVLEVELKKLTHSASLVEKCRACVDLLYNGEGAVYEKLSQVARLFEELRAIDPTFQDDVETVNRFRDYCAERVRGLERYGEGVDLDEGKIVQINERLAILHEVKRKYKLSLPELIAYQASLSRELESFESLGSQIEELKEKMGSLEKELHRAAKQLSEKRLKAKYLLEKRIHAELKELKLPHARIRACVEPLSKEGGGSPFNPKGGDEVEFVISMNPGQDFLPLRKTISGGELSRLFLAIKTVLSAKRDHPVSVFDEIDSGVGGDVGKKIGLRLKMLSHHAQIICITHLPQIAVFGDHHFVVSKRAKGTTVEVKVGNVGGEARVDEVARMLGEELKDGKEAQIARRHAEMLLKNASV